MRIALTALIVLVAGCGRSGVLLPEEEAAAPDVPDLVLPNAPRFPTPTTTPTVPPALPPLCDAGDADLLACFGFDGDTLDGSGGGITPATAGIAFAPGVDGSALSLTAGTGFVVPDDTELDPPGPTYEMWLRPASLPGGRYGLMDKDGQYGFFLDPDGSAYCVCNGGGTATTTAGAFSVGEWTHAACVLAPAGVEIFLDGVRADAGGACVSNTGSSGGYVGENGTGGNDQFLGEIDRLRIWRRPRTTAELCAEAGTCPP